uniref:G-protein coupled receptors family 1 profile domain-containing protein n=1 Tax=Chelydra serpentina TaxID=8475 RepID=A0A8C3SX27_CHESE
MDQQNLTTTVTEFIFLGLTQNHQLKYFLFMVFFIVYMITWVGNFTIIITVITDHRLHTPMYFLLANLAFMDVSDSSVNAPNLLSGLLSQHKTISFNECILQMFFFHFIGGAMAFFLVGMAIDRYVAIYKPLRYLIIMNRDMCVGLVVLAWVGGIVHSAVQMGLLLQFPFCGPNILDNFYCDVPQVIKVACADTHVVELQMVFNGGVLLIILFISLLISYTIILVKIRTHVTDGKRRQKAFSTCSAHLIVVIVYYMTLITVYVVPTANSHKVLNKLFSVFYTVLTPMINPVIYSLRNKEVNESLRKAILKLIPFRNRHTSLKDKF